MSTSNLMATVRKALISQTSEQLYTKLQKGTLLGNSKTVGIQILTERKEKGTFTGDLSIFTEDSKKETEVKVTKVKEVKVPKVKKEKIVKEKKERVVKEKKEKTEGIKRQSSWNFKGTVINKGQKAKFEAASNSKVKGKVSGEVVSCNIDERGCYVKLKNSDGKGFWKKFEAVEFI